MKKQFSISCRVISVAQQDVIATSEQQMVITKNPTENLTAPARHATPTTVNGMLSGVADQK